VWPKSVVRQVDLDREERCPPPRGFADISFGGRAMQTLRENVIRTALTLVVRDAMMCGLALEELVRCTRDLWEEEQAKLSN
jgi:hypothetical protein